MSSAVSPPPSSGGSMSISTFGFVMRAMAKVPETRLRNVAATVNRMSSPGSASAPVVVSMT